ncbi:MAG: type II toxin-antitoxin system VapC family toxin [Candidatus Saccharibacteria bacterium]|nr:type II toxin-antitoxin system VapC family toxin [Moraxellaceae bacterium]
MIGLDTNILARYYIDDAQDAESQHQRVSARELIESGQSLMVAKTVLLELEWVMRGYYGFSVAEIMQVFQHLCALPQVTIEDRETVSQAIEHCLAGLEFADALHLSSYRQCETVASFDDKKFARRVKRMGLSPSVSVPKKVVQLLK